MMYFRITQIPGFFVNEFIDQERQLCFWIHCNDKTGVPDLQTARLMPAYDLPIPKDFTLLDEGDANHLKYMKTNQGLIELMLNSFLEEKAVFVPLNPN